jgi:hypothetical protein
MLIHYFYSSSFFFILYGFSFHIFQDFINEFFTCFVCGEYSFFLSHYSNWPFSAITACETIFQLRFTSLYFIPKSEAIFNISVLHGVLFDFHIKGPKSLSDCFSCASFFVTPAITYISDYVNAFLCVMEELAPNILEGFNMNNRGDFQQHIHH